MKHLILFSLFFATVAAYAQNDCEQEKKALLQEIEHNNTTLAALRQKAVATKKQNEVGTALPDPKIGFANTWGNQPTTVTKQNVSIEQELDWGTLAD